MTKREKFEALRAKYIVARDAAEAMEMAMSEKYGNRRYLSNSERVRFDRLRAKQHKAGEAFSRHLDKISPRDWSYGVPAAWLYESLRFEDATRPANEPLSEVPPLSYGAVTPRT